MQKITTTILSLILFAQVFAQSVYQKDFDFYWKTIKDNFAYFDKQKVNWEKVRTIYQPYFDTCSSENSFIHLLENVNNELYNGHIFLNRNTSSSNRLIPSGADMKVIFEDGNFIIDQIKPGFNADLCGLKEGMNIIKFNEENIGEAIKRFLPKSAEILTAPMFEYAANMLLAGTHDAKRKITIIENNQEKDFYPDNIPNKTESNYSALLEYKKLEKNIGYIKINNSLGDDELINLFDSALDNLMYTNALIIDLRETQGGGTTTVARAIMGRFISKEMPYQKHIYTAEEKETGIKRATLELVSPRKNIYKKPLIVLVDYWTGSMGEGIAIGFDAMHRAKIAGTKMAGLLGEVFTFETPELKIPFSFPCVQLQNIYGQPREDFVPHFIIKNSTESILKAEKLLTTGH